METKHFLIIITILLLFINNNNVSGHCDTMDGPVVADAKKALENSNVNYALKWVQPDYENELIEVFDLVMKVRVLSPEAMKLSDRYFFETLVRLHRTGEGVPYTGIKPSGTPIDEKIKAADRSIETGNLASLKGIVPEDRFHELEKLFEKVMSLRNFDVNDVKAGRAYVEAYVQFFHFAEGEEEGHDHRHTEPDSHAGH